VIVTAQRLRSAALNVRATETYDNNGNRMRILPVIATLALGLTLAQAQNYTCVIDPQQEGGGGGRSGSGSGTLSLSNTVLTINISFSGLSGTSTVDHIHGPAPAGTPANVLYHLTPITTVGSTAGTIIGSVTLVNGTGGYTLAQQLSQLNSNLWYVNIHTTLFPPGEIRGQIIVSNTPPVVKNPLALTNGFQVTIEGLIGQRYATEVSSDLLNWSSLVTNVAPASSFDVLDTSPPPGGGLRFYRAKHNP
jgi:hypothetical protein